MIRKNTKMPCFLMNHSEICVHFLICPPIQKNSHKHYTFLMQTCQNCVHMQLSTISKCYTLLYKHVKIADYTFSIQMSTISKCCTFTTQTCQNCEHKQMSTISKHYTFLHKHVTTVHYIKHYTFPIQTCQNCGHKQMSTISKHYTLFAQTCHNCPLYHSLHFSYAKLPKLRPHPTVHYITHYTFLHKHITTVHHINHYTFATQNRQNCVHIQMSTISKHYTFAIQISSLHFPNESLSKINKFAHFLFS